MAQSYGWNLQQLRHSRNNNGYNVVTVHFQCYTWHRDTHARTHTHTHTASRPHGHVQWYAACFMQFEHDWFSSVMKCSDAWCEVFSVMSLHLHTEWHFTLLIGRQEEHPACKKTEEWDAAVAIWMERDADLNMAQLMPLSLASVKSTLVLPFWYRLTRVVPDKGSLNGCVCVFVLLLVLSCQVYDTIWYRTAWY